MERIDKPADFDSIAFRLGKEIHKHTIQLFVKGGKYGFRPWGTGVLVFAGGKYLLLTAAHVTSAITETENLYSVLDGKPVIISGTLQETDLGKDKYTDLAYIILHDKLGELLSKEYDFLPSIKINTVHQPVEAIQYIVFGYPAINIKEDTDNNKIQTGSQAFLTSIVDNEVYQNMGLEKTNHFVMHFDKKGTAEDTNETVNVSDPFGISGCGLWFITATDVNGKLEYSYELIGVVKGGNTYQIVATNIRILIDGLSKLAGIKFQ